MIEIVLNTTGINKYYKTNSLFVFPNPSYSELNIALPSNQSLFTIKIYDINGKLVIKKSNQTKLNISSLSSGQYFIQVIQDNHFYSTRFIK